LVRGYGTEELLEMAGAVEIPVPVLRRGDDADPRPDDALVAFGNGNGAELDPVTKLVGAVTPPVGTPRVVEFHTGKGAEVEEVP